jgi:hypothetical protein
MNNTFDNLTGADSSVVFDTTLNGRRFEIVSYVCNSSF